MPISFLIAELMPKMVILLQVDIIWQNPHISQNISSKNCQIFLVGGMFQVSINFLNFYLQNASKFLAQGFFNYKTCIIH